MTTAKGKASAPPGHIVQNCVFTGVQFNSAATDAIQAIATGLIENAKALGALAQVLKASNVQIDCMLKMEGPQCPK